jgi:L-threonylcarbamoyladenylate synthase
MPDHYATAVLGIATPETFLQAVSEADRLLRTGEVVAIPTETVYGLAAHALDSRAVARIFSIKRRPPGNPLIVHVASVDMARQYVTAWPATAEQLARSFWPGPLTLVLPRSPLIPDLVVAQGVTVAIRWPNHPFVQALIDSCGFPLAAPSANPSNQISPTTCHHVLASLAGQIPLVVDGGPASVGIESTVVDVTGRIPRVLRPGMIDLDSLETVVGRVDRGEGTGTSISRSPGLMKKHYAPKARLILSRWRDAADLEQQLLRWNVAPSQVHVLAHYRVPIGLSLGRITVLPRESSAFAGVLYAELHRCDDTGAQLIVVELPPDTAEWQGILDRLRRAAG